eukprot:TRINITY_DN1046_c0_g1_i1.p1 TRINITY_DN1046_c0_g1~~TRINITY_DN1046_c0_g1_i1.p1  ORF type:complete len:492 (+),score=53.15 TRINITY_DN1046_c0_g1_i1:83-1477(+)
MSDRVLTAFGDQLVEASVGWHLVNETVDGHDVSLSPSLSEAAIAPVPSSPQDDTPSSPRQELPDGSPRLIAIGNVEIMPDLADAGSDQASIGPTPPRAKPVDTAWALDDDDTPPQLLSDDEESQSVIPTRPHKVPATPSAAARASNDDMPDLVSSDDEESQSVIPTRPHKVPATPSAAAWASDDGNDDTPPQLLSDDEESQSVIPTRPHKVPATPSAAARASNDDMPDLVSSDDEESQSVIPTRPHKVPAKPSAAVRATRPSTVPTTSSAAAWASDDDIPDLIEVSDEEEADDDDQPTQRYNVRSKPCGSIVSSADESDSDSNSGASDSPACSPTQCWTALPAVVVLVFDADAEDRRISDAKAATTGQVSATGPLGMPAELTTRDKMRRRLAEVLTAPAPAGGSLIEVDSSCHSVFRCRDVHASEKHLHAVLDAFYDANPWASPLSALGSWVVTVCQIGRTRFA